ncbi:MULTISPECIES: nicotinate-nucleotide--dimethylbenzimidazole phosphoribosyltransferase [unclassified Pyramidobacter]|uniref:nicotinate-nucleotide--dimethylbenzimidazole phosphoribosyltransferase n=1 Tax=unclassified Pyramidobacter TaxID=2632171 RepID=UPI000EA33007|nr:nicotinate-nucleotide--dimethylbenzimidazole phosphoribosyltransferase [Pyramidobacter sp. CG50-2]RKJ78706.1 nicotinate-nucleotide--dimethylbenzimidazole phosphoribosyltransferase [Pyramidobacter sp. CG50-2]
MNVDLNEINSRLTGPDAAAVKASLERWSLVAKPLKSLGALEDLVTRIAGITGEARFDIGKRALVVMCADNGVIAQGVTQTDESITALVAADLAKGCSSANLMARVARVDVIPVDVGVKYPPEAPGLISRRVAAGTRDFTSGPAMTREQALWAIGVGIETARECREKGYRLIATGEMGIGNTTTCAAVAAVLLGCEPRGITGRGAGLSDAGLKRKIAAIEKGIAVNRPDAGDALDVLGKLGGFDIAAMAGLFIGGAMCRLPVVIDGVISAVSALAARRLCPGCAFAMIPSHMSAEPAARRVFDELGLKPVIRAGMRLGEGTGALCLFPLLDMAMALYDGLVFSDIGMEAYTPQS